MTTPPALTGTGPLMGVTSEPLGDDRSHRQPSLAAGLSLDLMHPSLCRCQVGLSRGPLLFWRHRGGFTLAAKIRVVLLVA